MKGRRTLISDRRQQPEAESEPEKPLIDNHGNFINEDRRVIPDRRLNNITIEEEWGAYFNEVNKRDKE